MANQTATPFMDCRARKYVIKSGDTLSSIANYFGVSVSDLLRWNPYIENPDVIYAGKSLMIVPNGMIQNKNYRELPFWKPEDKEPLPVQNLVAPQDNNSNVHTNQIYDLGNRKTLPASTTNKPTSFSWSGVILLAVGIGIGYFFFNRRK